MTFFCSFLVLLKQINVDVFVHFSCLCVYLSYFTVTLLKVFIFLRKARSLFESVTVNFICICFTNLCKNFDASPLNADYRLILMSIMLFSMKLNLILKNKKTNLHALFFGIFFRHLTHFRKLVTSIV